MTRRLVLAITTVAFLGAGAAASLAATPTKTVRQQEICIVQQNDPNHPNNTKDICVDW
ncbi:MAG TPA: hypothetical protein VNE21_00250 [Mycobacteriales bacterium]|nr:hypothetical protein [Mycobacteriales bacterium]